MDEEAIVLQGMQNMQWWFDVAAVLHLPLVVIFNFARLPF